MDNDNFVSPSKCIHTALKKGKGVSKSSVTSKRLAGRNLSKVFYRRRQKYRPKQPTDIKFVVSFTQTQYTREGAGVNA